MNGKKPKIAICYDFDGTLSPGNMQEYDFIKKLGMKSKDFWRKSSMLAREKNADTILAYMYQMIKEASMRDIAFKKEDFQNYGKHVTLYPGVDTWFKRVNAYGKKKGFEVQHFIISSGLKEMIEGTPIAKAFHKIYASSFMYDANGAAFWPATALNYTTKTQFLFRINKGCLDINDHEGINHFIPQNCRQVPFSNMIYIGDGETDIPCMRLVCANGGHAIAVYHPHTKNSKAVAEKLIAENRVNFMAPANYGENSKIESYVQTIIDKLAAMEKMKNI